MAQSLEIGPFSFPNPATAPGFLFLVVPEFREHSARARGVRQTLSFMKC